MSKCCGEDGRWKLIRVRGLVSERSWLGMLLATSLPERNPFDKTKTFVSSPRAPPIGPLKPDMAAGDP